MAHLPLPDETDFPPNPALGQFYTAPAGQTYVWNGHAWDIGFYDNPTFGIGTLGGLLNQIRTTLQDTDNTDGEYRYSTDSIITNINQGFIEMYRIRPDIFLELGFAIPAYTVTDLEELILIELQFIPALVYYAVGFTQLRDDEPTQDERASAFLGKFTSMLVGVA
jgi:hypothetical protein